MIFSQRRILDSAIATLEDLQHRRDVPADVASDTQAIALMLRHTRYLNGGGDECMRERCIRAIELLEELRIAAALKNNDEGDVVSHLDGIIARAREVLESVPSSTGLESRFSDFLYGFDTHLGEISLQAKEEGWQRLLADFCQRLLVWEKGFDPAEALAEKPGPAQEASVEPLQKNLQKYVREKLQDNSATVDNLKAIPGGFGHQTVLFSVQSKNLNDDLVMRRAMSTPFSSGVDCGELKDEFSLLKAMFARGFPVAEPLWFDEQSQSLPGPDFIISRRAPGEVQGDPMGGQGRISAHLCRELAVTAARIHALPPLTELGNKNSALQLATWKTSLHDCVHAYITSWYHRFLTTPHIPVPVLHGLFKWLLDHVPVSEDCPTLVHGDIGLHNLLIHDGRLSAVLDWETAHIGDPAEDVGYVQSSIGRQLDWPMFLREYEKEGLTVPDEKRMLFYAIWGNARNIAGCACVAHYFETGASTHVRNALLTYRLIPQWIDRAHQLIGQWDD